MADEIVVQLESEPTEITVVLEPPPPEIQVILSEVGLVGAPGPPDTTVAELLRQHVASATPHPVYDDGPSLLLLYQNAKV